ncbi:Retrovirus-related Pol polyprotein from transposon 17.6, partial [Mucuna pruriens]
MGRGYKWEDSQERTFQAHKYKLILASVLALPNFSKIFELKWDASNVGVGAVLLQEGYPIAYFSEKLKNSQINFSTYDKELCGNIIIFFLESLWFIMIIKHSNTLGVKLS